MMIILFIASSQLDSKFVKTICQYILLKWLVSWTGISRAGSLTRFPCILDAGPFLACNRAMAGSTQWRKPSNTPKNQALSGRFTKLSLGCLCSMILTRDLLAHS